jgi:hypothetical protein
MVIHTTPELKFNGYRSGIVLCMCTQPTWVKIEKINNLLQVDINRREQGCAAHYEQYCQHVVTALFNCNNLEQHGQQLVHSWPYNIVHACRYQLGTTCAFLAVYNIHVFVYNIHVFMDNKFFLNLSRILTQPVLILTVLEELLHIQSYT